jgi:hypothetical protein
MLKREIRFKLGEITIKNVELEIEEEREIATAMFSEVQNQIADAVRPNQSRVVKVPAFAEKPQEVADHETILPEIGFRNTRGYIESLAKQLTGVSSISASSASATIDFNKSGLRPESAPLPLLSVRG